MARIEYMLSVDGFLLRTGQLHAKQGPTFVYQLRSLQLVDTTGPSRHLILEGSE